MKKTIAVVLTIFMMIGISGASFAALPIDYTPQWTNIMSIVSSLGFSGNHGGATASVDGKPGTTKVEATLTVYKQSGGAWVYVDSDSDSTTTEEYVALSVNFDGISGVYYKAEFKVSVTRTGITESTTKTSYKTCP